MQVKFLVNAFKVIYRRRMKKAGKLRIVKNAWGIIGGGWTSFGVFGEIVFGVLRAVNEKVPPPNKTL